MKTDKIYIANILDCIAKIEEFTNQVTEAEFLSHKMMQSATILQLALIGEEANKISAISKEKITLPWREIIGFRNMIIHEYLNLELEIVWKTIQDDIPLLKEKLSKYKEN